ncbi:hypothetical protein HK405_009992 [Cladochytrium tenue]|nr:hypothetical protein HK405_009992 [Cladochytrium tenue]
MQSAATAAATALAVVAAAAAAIAVVAAARASRAAARLRTLNSHDLPVRLVYWVQQHPLVLAGLVPARLVLFPEGFELDPAGRRQLLYAPRASIAVVQSVPAVATRIFTADPAVARELFSARWREFRRPWWMGRIFGVFGPNILSTEGEAWRRHRRLASAHFSDATHALAFSETTRLCNEMFAAWESSSALVGPYSTAPAPEGEVVVAVPSAMSRLALKVVSSVLFGLQATWAAVPPAPGRSLSFEECLSSSFPALLLLAFLPKWLLLVPVPFLRRLRTQFEASLVEASEASDPAEDALTEEEAISDSIIFFRAGHETTASTLSFALILLALHPEEQDRVCDEVLRACELRGGAELTFADMRHLPYTLAVMNETLRLYPVAPRIARQNTTPEVQDLHGLSVPPGAAVVVALGALHRNRTAWGADAETFRPSRWLPGRGTDNGDSKAAAEADAAVAAGAYQPFGEAPHSCVGRWFARAEFAAALASVARRYAAWRVVPEADDGVDPLAVRMTVAVRPAADVRLAFVRRREE